MREVLSLLQTYNSHIILAMVILYLVLVACLLALWRKHNALLRRYNTKIADGSVGEIVDCLAQQTQAITMLESRLDDISARLAEHAENISACLQKVGIVRFDAFDDVGGEQSFSLVLLNGKGNGFALSSLYGRQDSRVYAKQIINGTSDRALSDEEKTALSKAMEAEPTGKMSQ
ncbi:MAG: DUF4446 family protein [Armatimonadota bacterium]|nr:DUF4446 family protein [Armatimonadota bacterium]